MKNRKLIIIFVSIIILICIVLFREFNYNGWIIPLKRSEIIKNKENIDYQIIDFDIFSITLPKGWKDKGYIVGIEGEIHGKLRRKNRIIHYEYGVTAIPSTETLKEYLFNNRYNSWIMGEEKIVNQTDSTKEVTYIWPIDPLTSDTIKTGIITDSIKRKYADLVKPQIFVGTPNCYSLTYYNDSLYFVPIEVPDEILFSDILNFELKGKYYNIVVPKEKKTGFAKVVVFKENFFPFALWAENIGLETQDILIEACKSVAFNDKYKLD